MSVESLIINKGTTCDIYRVANSQDAIGGRVHTETIHLSAQETFLEELGGNEGEVQGREGVLSTHRFFFVTGTDVNVRDIIKRPAGGPYTEIFDLTFVEDPHRFSHHIECLAVVRS